jgi:PKD repeat protein
MRKIYKPLGILRVFVMFLALGFAGTASAQLSGTYTLDSNSATGGTNFKTWTDFSTSIVSNGVNGAFTLNVITNGYNRQLDLPAIGGASPTNTITIKGNGKVLYSDTTDAVILMSGIDYLTIDGLVIRNTRNNANVKGIRVYNGSDYNTIKNCTIEFSNLTSTSTTAGAYIAFSASSTSSTTTSATNLGSFNTITKNLMRTTNSNSPGPAFGIAVQGNSSNYSSTAQNNTITGNTIENFYSMGIRNYYTNGNQINGNDISRANSTTFNSNSTLYGIYTYYAYATSRAIQVNGNVIHDMPYSGASASSAPSTTYGVYVYYNYGNTTYRLAVSNNTVRSIFATTNLYLGYLYNNYHMDLTGNLGEKSAVTISTSSSYNFYGWYANYTYNTYRINSNTVQDCKGGYYFYGIYNSNPQSPNGVTEINDNLVQNNSNSYYYTYYVYNYYASSSNATYPVNMYRNTVKNNSTNYYYMYCVASAYYATVNIMDNIVENNYTTDYYYLYAIASQYYQYSNIQRNIVRGNYNKTTLGYVYGVYDYYNYNSLVASNLIYNNIGYYGFYGIYAYNYNNVTGTYHHYVQNTIINDGNQSTYTSHYHYPLYIYLYYDADVKVEGNIVDLTGRYGYPMYTYNGGNGFTGWLVDRNTFRINGMGAEYWYNGSTTYNSFAAWYAAGTPAGPENYLVSNHNFTPTFASNKFVSQNNITTRGDNTKDVYGNPRNPSKSDRGAVEGFLDIAQIANTFAPNSPMCAGGYITPTVTFQNNFLEPVTGFKVACLDNGVLKSTVTFTNTIAVNGTGTVTFPPLQFSQSGNHKVKFFLLNADDFPSNDTMTFNFNVLKAPGGATLSQNTTLSSPFAQFVTTGKPDLTFPNEKMVYNMTAPGTLNYQNIDYPSKWVGSVTAKTINGFNANSLVTSSNSAPWYATLDAPKTWEDSTIVLAIKMTDIVTGCDTVYYRKVLIAPKAVPNAKLPAVFCERTDLIFETLSTVSSGSIDYLWDFGDGTAPTTEASPSHNYATYGPYTITLTTTTNPHGFVTKKTFNILVTEVPTATIINTNACEGVAVKLRNATVYGGSGQTSYSWNYGDGSPVFNTNNQNDVFKSYNNPGGYKVTLTATADGCSNSVTKIVYQFARPVASFTRIKGDCLNTNFEFANNSMIALGQMGYMWDFDDAGNKATVKQPVYNFNTAGTKQVKLNVVSEFGCVDSLIVPIVVKQTATTDYTYPFACSRTATPFTNTTNLNGENLLGYTWNFGDGFTSSSTSPSKSWFTIGPRVVKLTTTLKNGCVTETSKIINVGVQPAVNFTVEDKCAGSEVPFGNLTTFSQGDITYTWNFGDGNISNLSNPVHAYNSSISQTYTVQLKAEIAGGCADSSSKTVTINPLPTTCNFNIDGNLNAGKASTVNFVPTGGTTNNITYTWYTGDGNTKTSSAAGSNYVYNNPGKYCVTMIARNDAGCECSATKCIQITTDITDAESMNNAVSIYPNPNNGIFTVNLAAEISGAMTVNVYNTLGELVKTVVVDSTTTSVDLTDFASGVYVVKVIADNQIATKKITIAR